MNMEKAFSFTVDGKMKWFIFDGTGKVCWFAERDSNNDYLLRKAVPHDWMYIDGFCDCDFRGCDFSNLDITGTVFKRCRFDVGTFDYSYISYDGMIDCKFGSSYPISTEGRASRK